MYGLWYVTFGVLALTIVAIVMVVKLYDFVEFFAATAVVCGISSVVLILCSILLPIDSKREVEYFKTQSEYVEMAVENGTDLENIAITQTIIEQNEWLANAKAHLTTYGTWSYYYGSGVEDLEPIIVER